MQRRAQTRRAGKGFIEALESRRLLTAGQLDTSFSSDGMAQAKFSTDLANSVVAIEGNKTLVVGTAGVNDDIAMARFNFDGTPDTSFGTAGTGIIQIHPDGDSSNQDVAQAVAIQGDGKIVVAGGAGNVMLVLRFMPNGQLDKSFDKDGIVGISFPGFLESAQALSVVVQQDGKIVVAGESGEAGHESPSFAIARLNANGSLDTTFGSEMLVRQKLVHTGMEKIDFGDDSFAVAVALDTSGGLNNPKIVVAGGFDSGPATKMEIIRLNSNGSLDTSFDQDGKVAFSLPTDNDILATGVVVQNTGKVVVTGYAGPSSGKNEVFVALRLNKNGSIDNSFGGRGNGISSAGFGGDDEANSLTVGLNGRLFLGGSADGKIAIAALTPDGVLDPSFGSGGKLTTSLSSAADGIGVGIGYLGDRVVAAAPNFESGTATVVRYLDINPTIGAGQILNTASEQGPTPVTFLVTRDQTLPFDTIVNFTIGGTATAPTLFALKDKTADYTLTNMSIPSFTLIGHPLAPPFVDIPAGQNVVLVTLTPIDDKTVEGTETATFSVLGNSAYSIGNPHSVAINILDNDGTASTSLTTTADAYVRDGSDATTNFGSATDLEVKDGGTGFDRITYVKFDLSSVTTIGSAQLQMFGGLSDTQDATINTSLFTVADTSWTESGIDFNNAPGLSTSPLLTATITGNTAKTYSFDVTSYLQAQKAAGHNIVSFAFKDSATSNSFVKFNSKEAGSNPPTLAITAPSGGSVGTFKIASPHTTAVAQTTDVAVTWQVPSGSWQQLHTIDLQLSGDDGSLIDIRWNQENETLSLLDPTTGKFGQPQPLGSNETLSNALLDVLLKTSSKLSTGPTSPLVTVTFSLRFKNAAKGHHFSVEAAASNDNGTMTMFGLGKSITVT